MVGVSPQLGRDAAMIDGKWMLRAADVVEAQATEEEARTLRRYNQMYRHRWPFWVVDVGVSAAIAVVAAVIAIKVWA